MICEVDILLDFIVTASVVMNSNFTVIILRTFIITWHLREYCNMIHVHNNKQRWVIM